MKKIFAIILAAVVLTFAPFTAIYAESTEHVSAETYETNSTTTTYFDDGSYVVTTIKQSSVADSARSAKSSTYTVYGDKVVDLYDSKDNLQWTYTLRGTFRVNEGVSVTCTDSTYSSVIYVNAWSLTSHENRCSSNIAYGTAVYKKKVLFITTNTHDVDVSIGCNEYGVIG